MTERQKNRVKDIAVQKAVKIFSALIPRGKTDDYLNCGSENFLFGSRYFTENPVQDAEWSLGFAKTSVLPENITDEEYYIAGYLAFPPNRAEGVIDDMIFRAFAISDSKQRGIAVFCSLDCVGLSNTDVRDIRNMLKDYIADKDIISLNICSTHCHSAIDTQGLWGNLKQSLKTNPIAIFKDEEENCINGKNELFMAVLKEKAVRTIIEAVEGMKPGKLYHCAADATPFIRDKRAPDVVIKELTILKFIPSDSSTPTVAAIMGAHPTCLGEKNKMVSADYPYYFCEELEKHGNNAVFFQSAQAAVATARGEFTPEGSDTIGSISSYGTAIADCIISTPADEFNEVKPILNIAHSEVFLPVHNSIFLLIAKLKLVNNRIAYEKHEKKLKQDEYFVITEIGYVTLGNNLSLALMPGEVMPELVCGGFADSTQAYSHRLWNLPSLKDVAGENLVCIGLCNDAIGYIVPDNDFGSIFEHNHYEEAVSVGDNCASNLINAFSRLVETSKHRYINPDFIGENKDKED